CHLRSRGKYPVVYCRSSFLLSPLPWGKARTPLQQQLPRWRAEVFSARLGPGFFPDLFDGFVGVDLFVAEGDEGEDGVIDLTLFGGGGIGGAGGFPCRGAFPPGPCVGRG